MYKTAEENQIKSSYEGKETSYDGSGYVYNFPASTSKDEFLEIWKKILSLDYFNYQTKALIISFTVYNPS